MRQTFVRMSAVGGIAVLTLTGTATMAGAGSTDAEPEIARLPPAATLEEGDLGEWTPVELPAGVELEIDPATGCLTREVAASIVMPEGFEEAAIQIGPDDIEAPTCWELAEQRAADAAAKSSAAAEADADAYEPEMSDADIERYLAAFPLEDADISDLTPVELPAGVEAEIDPETGCLTRDAAASIVMPEGAEEAAIQIGPDDIEMPNCWDLANYLQRHPAA